MEALRLFWRKAGTYTVVGPFAIVLAFPFYWMLTTMFKRDLDLNYDIPHHIPYWYNHDNGTVGWPWRTATFYHVSYVFKHTQYPTWLYNTLIIGGIVVAITLLFALPAAYSLARLASRWGQSAGVGIFLVYLVPPTLLFLPLSRLITQFGLKDNWLWSLILVYPSFTIPFATWLLMGFFKTIPPELEDAALVDGCSRLRALWRIVFPISLPGILTVVIFSFSLCVNEFIYAISFISNAHHQTVSGGVPTALILGDVNHWQAIMAATLIPSIPLALLYNSFLDRFIKGFTGGAFR
jgi:multiple sugar transport system permease protein